MILNIFLKKAGFLIGRKAEINSNYDFMLIAQKKKKYIKFEFELIPYYQLEKTSDIKSSIKISDKYPTIDFEKIGCSISFQDRIKIKTVSNEKRELELADFNLLTYSKLSFEQLDGNPIVIDFDTESPGGFVIKKESNQIESV